MAQSHNLLKFALGPKERVSVQHKPNSSKSSPVSALFCGYSQTEIQAAWCFGGICRLCVHLWILRKATTVCICLLQWVLLFVSGPCSEHCQDLGYGCYHASRCTSRDFSQDNIPQKQLSTVKKHQRLLDIRCPLPGINTKGDLKHHWGATVAP